MATITVHHHRPLSGGGLAGHSTAHDDADHAYVDDRDNLTVWAKRDDKLTQLAGYRAGQWTDYHVDDVEPEPETPSTFDGKLVEPLRSGVLEFRVPGGFKSISDLLFATPPRFVPARVQATPETENADVAPFPVDPPYRAETPDEIAAVTAQLRGTTPQPLRDCGRGCCA